MFKSISAQWKNSSPGDKFSICFFGFCAAIVIAGTVIDIRNDK